MQSSCSSFVYTSHCFGSKSRLYRASYSPSNTFFHCYQVIFCYFVIETCPRIRFICRRMSSCPSAWQTEIEGRNSTKVLTHIRSIISKIASIQDEKSSNVQLMSGCFAYLQLFFPARSSIIRTSSFLLPRVCIQTSA